MLELVKVTRRYGDVVALDAVSLAAEPGSMLGFVGRNGAGKTTAMRVALGLVEPDEGEVRWKGAPATAEARRRFGYMPEERGLYPRMRVGDQLRYLGRLSGLGAAEAQRSAERWMARLGVAERANDRVEALSLGNQQRVQLAAALVHGPDVLVLDEPFSGLDPVGVDALAEALREEVDRGAPVVFSSHQLELVERLCDAVVVIDRGRVVAAGPVAELRAAHARRRVAVEVAGAPAGWPGAALGRGPAVGRGAGGGDGWEVVERAGDRVVLDLADGTDDQDVLDAARAAGRVRHFGVVTPTLSELFREVVPA